MIQIGIAEADYGLGYLIWLNGRILKKQGKQESKKIRKVIYDKIGKKAKAKVVLVTDNGTICSISKKSLLDNQKKVKKSETEIEE